MKQLITVSSQSGFELPLHIADDLDAAIKYVKEKTLLYFRSNFKIYPLDHPLTVRYLDNKIFID